MLKFISNPIAQTVAIILVILVLFILAILNAWENPRW